MPRGSKGERRPADVVGAAVIRTAPAPGRWPGAITGARVGRSLLQAERSGSKSRRSCQN
jgi:hypothetical protein